MKTQFALSTALVVAVATAGPVRADDQQHQQEAQIGQQVAQELKKKGEIIERPNALYDALDPIARRIAAVADPQYDFPFHFTLVRETQPNAFAVPGGNVYVTDSLLHFVQNQEELAGVLCHETSHDIHHDVLNNMVKNQTVGTLIDILGSLTGMAKSTIGQLGENVAYTLQSDTFSRQVEHNADHKGAITCAQAGINPWGMIWLFQNFEKADTGGSMEAISDHPTDTHRIDDLEAEFRADPAMFGKFSSNIASATPLSTSTATKPVVPSSPAPESTASLPAHYCCAPPSH